MTISTETIEQEIIKTQNKGKNNHSKDFKYFTKKTFGRINNNKDKVKILIPIAIISVIFMIYIITNTMYNVHTLNNKKNELYNLKYFNIKVLENNTYTKDNIKGIKTLDRLIEYNSKLKSEQKRYNEYLDKLQSPYYNLTKHILLPQLNIWKDPFIEDVDIDIIGAKFLEKNKYDDIKLIKKWSNFFKNIGYNNEFNEVEDITIGNIVEENEYFYIPINIKFIANSKRSFLLLIEKLSVTSNQTNISLINEFMYNLRINIITTQENKIKTLQKDYNDKFNIEFNIDKTIGYHLYQRIFDNQKNILIDDNIIDQTIKKTISCDNESITDCYYKFRDKYRSIPSLAYTIGLNNNKNKTKDFKKFFKELPPIISIDKFTFDRNMEQNIENYENIQYKGEIQMNIYGQSIPDTQVDEIATLLGKKCILAKLTPSSALEIINNTIINLGNTTKINTTNTSNLQELQIIMEKIKNNYQNLTNYKKTIKLFEIYRMLKDGNLCKT